MEIDLCLLSGYTKDVSEEKDEWYVSRSGQRFGPVTFAEMVESARAGRLEPRTDMVIGGGLADWKPAGEIDGLFERREPGQGGFDGDIAGHTPPKGLMADSGSFDFRDESGKTLKLPGASRLGYFLGVTVLPVLLMVGLGTVLPKIQEFVGKEYAPWAALILFAIPFVVMIAIVLKRFENLAMSGAWFFGLIVPILNWWIGYRLFACPPGYGFTKKLDRTGKVLAVIYWAGPVLGIVAGIVFAGTIKEAQESGKLQEFINKYEQQIPKIPNLKKSESGR